MKEKILLTQSLKLATEIESLCKELSYKNCSNIIFQTKKSSSSVYANVSEAQYPQSLADMLSKFKIARKECVETESWLKILLKSDYINENSFKPLCNLCGRIRRLLTSSCVTIENKLNNI